MDKIKVLIADDHRVVREGLAAILKTKEDIIGLMNVYISVKVPHISIEKYTTYKLERNNFVHNE